jgi:diguanylate cyclase (GGDEF)-like protein/PAS domain S-box-containing protein
VDLLHTDADLVAVLDQSGRVHRISPTVGAILGVDHEQAVGGSLCSLLSESDTATVRALGAQLRRTGRVRSVVQVHRCDGAAIWFDVAAQRLDGGTGLTNGDRPAGEGIFVCARDVTDDVLASLRLAESEQRWRLAFEHSPIGAAVVSREGDILLANESLGQMLGYRVEALTRMSLRDITFRDDREADAEKYRELISGGVGSYTVEKRHIGVDGRLVWGQVTAAAVPDLSGEVHGVIVQIQDITQRREAELELANRALHDPLTGLPNRFLVQQWLASALDEHLGRDVGVLYCDLDRFKVVNDSLGHAAGDELLVQAAGRLRSALRPDDLVGRVGGDEFVVVCERLTGPTELMQVAGRLAGAFDTPIRIDGHSHTITVSTGGALGRAPDTAETLLMRADMALLRAKRLGRARHEMFDPGVDHIATRQDLELEEQLRASIGAGELRAYYQPIVHLRDRTVAGHEALLRWAHPERGLLVPDGFLQMAETTGLIRSLGWWVLGRACRDTAAGIGGLGSEGSWISVNASPSQLTRLDVFGTVQEVLAQTGLPPQQLHIEVTETALMQAGDAVAKELGRLRDIGVGVVLDDFGTGFSSLSLLRDFPVSMVKIDKSFVAPLVEDASAFAIVRAVLSMGRDLGLPVVAEGVESEEQAGLLAELGCSHAQGFLFGTPERADSDTQWVSGARVCRPRTADG